MRRSLPFALAIGLHGGLIALLVNTPPATLLAIKGDIQRFDVRFYTISDADAQSDAQLVEPPLSEDAADPVEDAPAPVAEPAAVETPDPVREAEDPPMESPQQTEPGLSASEDGPAPASEAAPTTAPAPGANASAASRPPARSDAPVITTQQRPGPRRSAPATPSFADILARAETRLDPDDFRIILSLGGVRETVRESFCLSSSAANLEAGDCPEGPNPNSAELARFGLQGLGEEPPEFLEDMDRMAFQLRQLGANPSQVERIMLALRESRREAINTPGVNRAMQRDREGRTDNLGNLLPDPD